MIKENVLYVVKYMEDNLINEDYFQSEDCLETSYPNRYKPSNIESFTVWLWYPDEFQRIAREKDDMGWAAAHILELNIQQRDLLFDQFPYGEEDYEGRPMKQPTVKDAVRVLENLAETGVVDWGHESYG